MPVPSGESFWQLGSLEMRPIDTQPTFLKGRKAPLFKLQLVASHKLHSASASAVSRKCFVDWLMECTSLIFIGQIFLCPFYSHHLDPYLRRCEPQGAPPWCVQGPQLGKRRSNITPCLPKIFYFLGRNIHFWYVGVT